MEISLPVTLAVLGAALLHASWNVLVKSGADKELETINIAVGSGLVALAAALFLPAPARASWPWLAGSALVHILYFAFLAGAYRWGELSYVYPVMRGGGPMIVALVGAPRRRRREPFPHDVEEGAARRRVRGRLLRHRAVGHDPRADRRRRRAA